MNVEIKKCILNLNSAAEAAMEQHHLAGDIPMSTNQTDGDDDVPIAAPCDADVEVTQDREPSQDVPTLTPEWSPDTHPDSCPCPDIPRDSTSVNLPCYIYNCPLEYLSEQLVNKWTFDQPQDIYEDLTFQRDEVRGQSLDEDPVGHRQRRISELELGRREGQADDVYGNAKELKKHCTMVSETFLRCFVKGQASFSGFYKL